MRNLLLIISLFLVQTTNTMAQLEANMFIGTANYSGDLAENDIQLAETKISVGIFGKFYLTPKLLGRVMFTNAKISGDDKNSVDLADRGLAFNASINEIAVGAEWKFLGEERSFDWNTRKGRFSPYVFLCMGTSITDVSLSFPPSRAADFPEPGDQDVFFVIPGGAGIRYDITKLSTISAEIGSRYVFSDYLDDVSVNGNPNAKDWYIIGGISMSLYIDNLY